MNRIFRWLAPGASYAEIHYTPVPGFSLLSHSWPEILADAPYRVEPGFPIPIVLLIKDADRFPVRLHRVRIGVEYADGHSETQIRPYQSIIRDHCWCEIVPVQPAAGYAGDVRIMVELDVERNGRRRTVRQHNYRGSARRLLQVTLAADPLPCCAGWLAGDLHSHSIFTDDPVEFGAPLPAMRQAAAAIGLGFFAVTDHSYDLGEVGDPEPEAWRRFQTEVAACNGSPGPVILPGEEVSCGNHRGQNVHLLILNHPRFIPGSGDGARHGLQNHPDFSIEQVLDMLDADAAAFAAHPAVRPPVAQRLLLRRGRWETEDYRHPRLDGLEALNGGFTRDFHDGFECWRRLLQSGSRLAMAAGTDAHGNFNRFRQVRIPLVSLHDHDRQRFGWARTLVHTDGVRSVDAVIAALRRGAVMATTGPAAHMTVHNPDGQAAGPGESVAGNVLEIRCRVQSTAEFGRLQRLRLYLGDLACRREILYKDIQTLPPYEFACTVPIVPPAGGGYIRLECDSRNRAGRHWCGVNPVWIGLRREGLGSDASDKSVRSV